MIALGNNAARDATESAQPLFWGGLVLIYAPIVFRLLSASTSRAERISLVVILGASLYVVRILASPVGFARFDELGTLRATYDVMQSGHYFSSNPIVVSTEGFPGLGAVTAAVAQLTGMSVFHAGLIVIGLAKVTLMLALFLFLERVTGSARAAGIGAAVYACNPSFLYFDSQFAYESLALAIGMTLLLVVVRWSDQREGLDRQWAIRGLVGAMAILIGTLVITHHMTTFAVLAFLLGWTAFAALADRASRASGALVADRTPLLYGPALPAMLTALTAGAWFAFVAGGVTIDELGNVITGAVDSTVRLVFGGTGPKTLFQGSGGTNTFAAKAIAVASVIPLVVLIPLGLRRTWRAPDSGPIWRVLALAAVLYPATLGLRLTLAGSETSQRASEFVFVGVAFFAGLLISELRWPRRWLGRAAKAAGITAVVTVIFLGGFIIGELPATRQPGPFLVGAEDRSISPQGLNAARFAAARLPSESRILVDRQNATLIGSYGDLNPVFGQIDGIPVERIFFNDQFDQVDRRVVRDDLISYIAVDNRLAREVPLLGYYFESGEPGAFRRREPIDAAKLTKFNLAAGLSRIFANGHIAIYATSVPR